MTYKVAVLSGDYIGPEVMAEAIKVLKAVAQKFNFEFEFKEGLVGGVAWEEFGEHLPKETMELCKNSDAILFGSVGGPVNEQHLPKWDGASSNSLLALRKQFDLYANLRPAKLFSSLSSASPLKTEIAEKGFDILIVRELTGGIYFGKPRGRDGTGKDERAFDSMVYSRREIERIAHVAFKAAKKRRNKVTSIDKANVLTTSVFWREVVTEVANSYPDVEWDSMFVDNATQQLIRDPAQFDVMLCGNMFGDIISDEAVAITGSLGMGPSASLAEGTFGMYEPSGGSAPDIAGKGVANPIAQILSGAMMLKYSFSMEKESDAIEKAVENILNEDKVITPDLGGKGSTSDVGDAVVKGILK
jgi:3-isopropylmalate dehydrogenase